ncbi:unnamed protein product [Mycena citricolor]|uniref:Uncharacterized protein n=1 Tax=Mycena citricolor TaxID=2018698 RepID=A0AAD2HU45_9AGAR|nr:unnamed protein product [Mycena citricolor]
MGAYCRGSDALCRRPRDRPRGEADLSLVIRLASRSKSPMFSLQFSVCTPRNLSTSLVCLLFCTSMTAGR